MVRIAITGPNDPCQIHSPGCKDLTNKRKFREFVAGENIGEYNSWSDLAISIWGDPAGDNLEYGSQEWLSTCLDWMSEYQVMPCAAELVKELQDADTKKEEKKDSPWNLPTMTERTNEILTELRARSENKNKGKEEKMSTKFAIVEDESGFPDHVEIPVEFTIYKVTTEFFTDKGADKVTVEFTNYLTGEFVTRRTYFGNVNYNEDMASFECSRVTQVAEILCGHVDFMDCRSGDDQFIIDAGKGVQDFSPAISMI